jgi:hypothetical protein
MPSQHGMFRLTLIPSSSQQNHVLDVCLNVLKGGLGARFGRGWACFGLRVALVHGKVPLTHSGVKYTLQEYLARIGKVDVVLRYSKMLFLVGIILGGLMFATLPTVHGAVSVSITPGSQVISQFQAATYTISLPGAMYAGSSYTLSMSGLGASFPFSPNPVVPPATSVLTIDLTNYFACPGTYPFVVTATNATGHGSGTSTDTGTGTASFTVLQYGPPLQVTVTTDKATYQVGDTVTILISANRPAEGQLTIQSPSGAPSVFNYNMGYGYGPSYSITKKLVVNTVGRYAVIFQADDFCSVSSSQTAYFDVSPNSYDVSISLSGVPPEVSAPLTVDNSAQGTVGGAEIKKLTFPISTTHQVMVDQYVPGQGGVQYFAAQNTWSVSSTGSHTFDYVTQYRLNVATDPDGVTQITNGGWYNSGATVQMNQPQATINGPAGTQYVFQTWLIDGAPQSGNAISVNMDKPHDVVAKYQTQYQLVIDSPYGDPKGAGYYPAGSTASFSVTSPQGILIQQVFDHWEGDFTGTSPQGSVNIDKPKLIHAVWTTSYTQLYIVAAVIGAIIIIAAVLRLRRRQAGPPPAMKPTPPMPGEPGAEAETPPPTDTISGEQAMQTGGTMQCPRCGTDVPTGQTFCHNCGAKMEQAT